MPPENIKRPLVCYVLMWYRNGASIWNWLMLTNILFFKCCTSILNIMCGSCAFHSAEFYLIRAWNKKQYTLCYFYTLEKNNIFLMKLKMTWKTHCLSHNIQSKTRLLSRFLEKSKIWDCHSCCVWDRICVFNGFYFVLFSMSVCPLFIFIVIFYLLI